MRPKKRVLLIDVNELQRSRMRLVLATKNIYSVRAVASAAEARSLAATWDAEVIVAMLPAPGVGMKQLLDDLHAEYPSLPSLVLAPRMSAELAEIRATAIAVNAPMVDVLERLRLLTARKRGPITGSSRMTKPVRPVPLADVLAKVRPA